MDFWRRFRRGDCIEAKVGWVHLQELELVRHHISWSHTFRARDDGAHRIADILVTAIEQELHGSLMFAAYVRILSPGPWFQFARVHGQRATLCHDHTLASAKALLISAALTTLNSDLS